MSIIVSGQPQKGSQRGSQLGFPTINLPVANKVLKEDWGVYFSYIYFDKKKLPAVSHLGPILTFGGRKVKCETHIISWRQDVAPKFVKVKLFKKIREIKKFDSKDDLIKQIDDDIIRARKYFKL